MNININHLLISLILFLSLSMSSCERNKNLIPSSNSEIENNILIENKINGVNIVAINSKIDSNDISPIVKLYSNSVAIVPFGFIRSGQSNVEYNLEWQWHGEKKIGTIEQIKLAKEANLFVLLKPHLWTHDGWIGDLNFDSETEWNEFETTYTNFILDFAKLADSMKVEMLCVGVELKQVAKVRPQFWNSLIDSVRSHYSGKLTYAANWDNFSSITFWDKLDFIGIEAYFPLSESKTPTVNALLSNWKPIKDEIKSMSFRENKPVLFTEFGYRNIDFTGKEPYKIDDNQTLNNKGQNNGYTAIFETFWDEPWFAGGYLWKWHPKHDEAGGKDNNRFTPQNKPAETVISNFYESTY